MAYFSVILDILPHGVQKLKFLSDLGQNRCKGFVVDLRDGLGYPENLTVSNNHPKLTRLLTLKTALFALASRIKFVSIGHKILEVDLF